MSLSVDGPASGPDMVVKRNLAVASEKGNYQDDQLN